MTRGKGSLISVVVPIFGGEQYVEQCIDSLMAQTHRNLEVILVDDGSPDRSGDICDHAATLDKRIRVIHQKNSGLVSARKAGVSIATGRYLGFVDGDDWVGTEYFGRMHELVESCSADLAISGHVRDFLGRQESISPLIKPGVFDKREIDERIFPSAIFNGVFFQHGVSTYVWNKLFRRKEASHFIRTIPQHVVIGEDAALTYPYLQTASKIVVTHEGEYFYRQRPRSILKSASDTEVEYIRLSTLFQYLIDRLSDVQTNSNIYEQLRNYFYALVLIRTGGVIQSPTDGAWFTPFPGLTSSKKIVVYSSGSFGQLLIESLNKIGSFEVVGWVDEDVQESQRVGLPVTPVESLRNLDFDLVLIASIDTEFSDKVACQLSQFGIPETKISRVLPDFDALVAVLTNIGFNLGTFSYVPEAVIREGLV